MGAPNSTTDFIFVYKNLALGGVQSRIVALANVLVGRGYSVDIVTTHSSHRDRTGALSDKVGRVSLGNPRTNHVFRLRRLIETKQPKIVFGSTSYYNILVFMSLAMLKFKPIIVAREHSDTLLEFRNANLSMRLVLLATKLVYRHVDHLVAVSNGVADSLAKFVGISRNKIKVIYNPIYEKRIDALAKLSLDRLCVEQTSPTVVGAGRLVPQKNFALLLESFVKVVRVIPNAQLYILGDGPLRTQLERCVLDLNIEKSVTFVGQVNNPYAWYNKADVFVLSSDWEGFGNVLVEAMACGCRIVSTDCPSGPSEILKGGRFGRLAPVADPVQLADQIVTAINSPPTPGAIEHARSFSIDASADAYLSMLGWPAQKTKKDT